MTQSYTPFLTLEIDHPYFNGDSKAPISISPTRDTARFITRYGLVINKKQGAITLFAPSAVPLADLFKMVVHDAEINSLDFSLTTEDPFYSLYTDLPEVLNSLAIYTSENALDESEHEPIVLFPEFQQVQSFPEIGQIYVKLNDLIGVLETKKSGNFILKMEARSLLWKYNVLNISTLNELAIVSDDGIQFSGPTEVSHNGQSAMQFVCKMLIPCRAVPEYSFGLSNNGRLIINGLPSPSLESIEIKVIDSVPVAYSSIFVYL